MAAAQVRDGALGRGAAKGGGWKSRHCTGQSFANVQVGTKVPAKPNCPCPPQLLAVLPALVAAPGTQHTSAGRCWSVLLVMCSSPKPFLQNKQPSSPHVGGPVLVVPDLACDEELAAPALGQKVLQPLANHLLVGVWKEWLARNRTVGGWVGIRWIGGGMSLGKLPAALVAAARQGAKRRTGDYKHKYSMPGARHAQQAQQAQQASPVSRCHSQTEAQSMWR